MKDWQALRSAASDEAVEVRQICERCIRVLDRTMAPASRSEVAEMLVGFVEMLNVLEPGEKGIELYELALEALPRFLYPDAIVRVARTHRYRSLPLPADFLGAVAGELAFLAGQRRRFAATAETITTMLNQRDHQRRMTGA